MFRKKISSEVINSLSYKSFFWPYASWIALITIGFVFILLAVQEQTRVGVYVGIPILLVLIIVFYVFGLHRQNNHQGEIK
jgi:AAT family amino acid transporter